ncbi:hypothetical protein C455_13630 [Haloferax larsenii JCM 13917]|nr:hypothetical protein [Haloferax larsenii]ELZ77381.1 hypothetical protein C455_13630 [Haloferax larsenii JCM 13917]
MPGTPDPVLGSQVLTHIVASVTGLVVVAVVYATRRRLAHDWRPLALLGFGYATVTLSVWTVARLATDALPSGIVDDPVAATGFLAFSFTVLAGFVVAAARLYASRGLLVPLVGLFGVTELVWWSFLHVRGETDALGMFALFGPVLVIVLFLAAGTEYAVRTLWNRAARGGDRSMT